MTSKTLFGIFFLIGSTTWAAAPFQPLDVKPGTWEATLTTQQSGAPPIPPELLARLTPEQRARLEANAKARQAEGPKTTVSKRCLKKEDLSKPFALATDQKACKPTVLSSSSSKIEISLDCAGEGMKSSGTVRFEAVNSESVKFTSQISVSSASGTMTVNGTGTGKWLGATCTEAKN